MTIRTRVTLDGEKHTAHTYRIEEACFPPIGYVYQSGGASHTYTGLQQTFSEGHPFPRGNRRKFAIPHDIGGEFYTRIVKFRDESPILPNKTWKGSACFQFNYNGLYPVKWSSYEAQNSELPGIPASNDVIAWGILGFQKASPDKPQGQLAQALYELKAGMPGFHQFRQVHEGVKRFRDAQEAGVLKRLVHHGESVSPATLAKRAARASANGFLTWEFDWLPFYSDVRDFCKNVHNSSKTYERFREAGYKNSRRKVSLVNTESHTSRKISSDWYGANPLTDHAYQKGGDLYIDESSSRTVWYSAAFVYYVPPSNGSLFDRIRAGEQLLRVAYGLELSPRSLWAVLPWSWLADWSTTVGASASNLTNILYDGLTSRYAYVMVEEKSSTTYNMQGCTLYDGSVLSGRQTLSYEMKFRAPGYSFGFALKPSDYSDKQWAILAALGISKGFKNV